jgi:hypothetical protein
MFCIGIGAAMAVSVVNDSMVSSATFPLPRCGRGQVRVQRADPITLTLTSPAEGGRGVF